MGKKMYYTEQEAAKALGISAEELANYVRDDKLRVYQDGARKMFRVDDVDALAGPAGEVQIELETVEQPAAEEVGPVPAEQPAPGEDHIELAPVEEPPTEQLDLTPPTEQLDLAAPPTEQLDLTPPAEEIQLPPAEPAPQEPAPVAKEAIGFEKTMPMDRPAGEVPLEAAGTVPLDQADTGAEKAKSKEDTVITAEGVSIFDEEDLEIEAADPMAKTQIAPTLDDQISIDGVGSGSGLLDLTRESDDTSLGAEVLGHIDEETEGAAELEPPLPIPQIEPYEPERAAAVAAPAASFVEEVDAGAGMFGGMIVGCAVVALVLASVPLASARGAVPNYLEWFKENLLALAIGAVVLVLIATVIGLFMGRAIAEKQKAMRDMRT